MPSLIAQITDKLEASQKRRDELMAAAETAGSFDDVRDELDAIDAAVPGLKADLSRAERDREVIRRAPAAPAAAESPLAEGPITSLGAFRRLTASLTDQFLGSEEWAAFKKDQAPSGKFSENTRLQSPKVPIEGSVVASLLGKRMRTGALVTGGSATSAGAFVIPDDTGIYDTGALQRELSILDLIVRGTTDSDSVEYVRLTGLTNNAAPVAEADDVDDTDTTGLKPQSTFTLERVQEGVKTIAHWEAATKRALADAGQVRTIIEGLLRYGLLEALENEVISGNDSGEHFDGILHVSGTQDQTFDTDIATTLRRAITKVRVGGKTQPNGIVLHPVAAEALDIELINNAVSYYRSGTIDETARIWGLPIVQSEGLDENQAIVADFRKAVLWDRQDTTIEVGYPGKFFLKNLVAILAELRAAFGVIRPAAFVLTDIEY